MEKYLIGTDIGTSGTKSVIIDLNGRILAEDYRTYMMICDKAGWAQQNAVDWQRAAFDTIAAVIRKSQVDYRNISAMCVSGLFAGSGVPVDGDINPLHDAIIWMDRRAIRQKEEVDKIVDAKELFKITGNRNDAYFGFNKMLWIRDNKPEIWSKIRYFLPSNTYVVYKLTGEIAVDITSAANIGGIYDFGMNSWSSQLLEQLGIPNSMLPANLMEPGDVAGYVTAKAAAQTGLPVGIPVCAGCTDCLASNLAAGVIEEKQQSAIMGTSINWSILHKNKPTFPELVSMPNVTESKSMIYTYGGVSTAGALTNWFLNTLAPYTIKGSRILPTTYKILESEASAIPAGCQGLLSFPGFMGERSPLWDSAARGIFCGLTLGHSRAHMYRALLESTAFAVRLIRESSTIFLSSDNKCIVSGGASQSSLWLQIIADVNNTKIIRTSNNVQAPVGDALVAGVSCGEIRDYSIIHDWCRYENAIEPDKRKYDMYTKLFEHYKHIYYNTRANVEAIGALSCEND